MNLTLDERAVAASPRERKHRVSISLAVALGIILSLGAGLAPSASAAANPTGNLDKVEAGLVSGWAWDPNNAAAALTVELRVFNASNQDVTVGKITTTANITRSDLVNAKIGTGKYAFQTSINWFNYPAGTYKVAAYAIKGGAMYPLPNPRNFTVQKLVGGIDRVNDTEIKAFVWKPDAPNYALTMKFNIYNSANAVVKSFSVLSNAHRSDLANLGWGTANYGVLYTMDWSSFAAGTYRVEALAIDGTGIALPCGDPKYYTKTVVVPPPPPAPVWPGPTNTGVPAGTKLTVHEGDLKITVDNTVIDSTEIRGLVRIEAKNVVIKNSLITGRLLTSPLSLIYVNGPNYSVTVKDSTLYAKNPSPYIVGVIGSNFTLERVNIYNVTDQVNIIGSNVTIRDSWLHNNLYYLQDPVQNNTPTHDDNVQIQIGSNIQLIHNTMESTHNAAVMVTQDQGVVGNLLIENNRISHGACALNLAEKTRGTLKGFVIKNNVFVSGTQVYSGCAIITDATSIPLLTLSGNTWTAGGTVAVTKR